MTAIQTKLRRKALVENPIIVELMGRATKIGKLIAEINKEFKRVNQIVTYVRLVDRQTAKSLGVNKLYTNVKQVHKHTKQIQRQLKNLPDNVIPFRPSKKSAA